MSLKYPVKINRVNNLSDARYCAGMGVEILGISNEVSVQEYMAIMGWITGVDICLDIYQNSTNLLDLIKELNPTFLETSDSSLIQQTKNLGIQIIYRIEDTEYELILEKCALVASDVAYITISKHGLSAIQLKNLQSQFKIIVNVDGNSTVEIENLCIEVSPSYIALNGGNEVAPGLKNFDEMAEVLEYLESED